MKASDNVRFRSLSTKSTLSELGTLQLDLHFIQAFGIVAMTLQCTRLQSFQHTIMHAWPLQTSFQRFCFLLLASRQAFLAASVISIIDEVNGDVHSHAADFSIMCAVPSIKYASLHYEPEYGDNLASDTKNQHMSIFCF